MAVRIHLNRVGKKNAPLYRVVVADSRRRRDGKYIEKVGYYNPTRSSEFHLNVESIKRWVEKGAKLSSAVSALMKRYQKENI